MPPGSSHRVAYFTSRLCPLASAVCLLDVARRNLTYNILLETRNLYFADYPLLHELPLRDDRHLYAPTVLFFVEHCTPESPGTNKAHGRRLMPLLIQLTRLPSGNRVFLPTPDDEDQDSNAYWVWQFAKMHVQSADGHMHECELRCAQSPPVVAHSVPTHAPRLSFSGLTSGVHSPRHGARRHRIPSPASKHASRLPTDAAPFLSGEYVSST